MIKVLHNAEVYAPGYLGRKDVIVAADKISAIVDTRPASDYNCACMVGCEVIEIDGNRLVPGFIDNHVHILGGGGEGGFMRRTPEILLSDIISGGVTTLIGVLGTDGIGRDMHALVAKAKGLEEEGISTYIMTGSYDVPVRTLTGSIEEDVMMIDKCIGTGEIALSDHRSSQPTFEDFVKLVAVTRRGGILSGKAGVVNVHLGDGSRRLDYMIRLPKETEIPVKQVIPTHINRSEEVFEAGYEYARMGGYVDMTTSSDPLFLEPGEVKASHGIKRMLDLGINPEQITCSSDGQGSMPIFDPKTRELVGLGVCELQSLYREVKDAFVKDGVKFEHALMTITSNAADAFKLTGKGRIEAGKDADFVVLDKDNYEIKHVLAKGKLIVKDGTNLIKGTFEKLS